MKQTAGRIGLTLLAFVFAWLMVTRAGHLLPAIAAGDDLAALRTLWAAFWALGIWAALAFIWGTE